MMQIPDTFDVVVVGGGTTGCCAAIAAARQGCRVALAEALGFLGGNACNGMAWYGFHSIDQVQVVGGLPLEIIQRLRTMGGASEFFPDPVAGSMVRVQTTLLKLCLLKMAMESGVQLFFHTQFESMLAPGCGRFRCKQQVFELHAPVFIDCTDAGDVAISAGADWWRGRETDGKMQAASGTLFIGGVDMEEMLAYFRAHPRELRPIDVSDAALEELIGRMPDAPVFGMGAFGEIIARAHAEGSLYPRDKLVGQAFPQTGEMMLVGSRVENADPTDAMAYTQAEIEAQLQMESILHLLHNYIPGCKHARIIGSGHTLGIRESCHVKGDYLLTAEDLLQGKPFPDAIALGAYHLDVHAPDHPGIDSGMPPIYQIPYASLLPAGVEGVLIAGRAFSATQLAQASTRVIPIAAATGQAAGIAASLAIQNVCSLRSIDRKKLQAILKKNGAILSA